MIAKRNSVNIIVMAALLYALTLPYLTGLIPGWGRWYTDNWPQHYRQQVDAFLHGRIALSGSPCSLDLDLAWSGGGVQQSRGLGIALWQLPFNAAAKLFGASGFPDTVIFGAALGIVAWRLLRSLSEIFLRGSREGAHGSSGWLMGAGAAAIFLLFPPFLGLMHSRFAEHEQAVAYGYLFALLLVSSCLSLINRPTRARYYVLCSLAGLGGCVRPTLIFYGVAAVVVGGFALRAGDKSRRDIPEKNGILKASLLSLCLGCCLFVLGSGALLVSNHHRFGSPFEFGYRLNMNAPDTLYATRFEHPFQAEPVLSAGRELFGLLFQVRDYNGNDYYRPHFFPGQSDTVRWREVYLSTYDLSYVFLILGGGIAGLAAARQQGKGEREAPMPGEVAARVMATLAAWGVLSTLFLVFFYLRTPVMASRYLLDFMPAFAALICVLWLALSRICLSRGRPAMLLAVALLSLSGWMVRETRLTQCLYGGPASSRREELQEDRAQTSCETDVSLRGEYVPTADDRPLGMIPFNGSGWLPREGYVMPAVTLFVQDMRYLELSMVHDDPSGIEESARAIRAKVGLEDLERVAISRTGDRVLVRFRGPQNALYRSGIQPLFVAFVPKEEVAVPVTAWRLLRVRWN